MNKDLIIFSVIAMRDVEFFVKTAHEIKKNYKNYDVKFISFFQPGNKIIIKNGFECFNIYEKVNIKNYKISEVEQYQEEFKIKNMHKFTVHEKLTNETYNHEYLLKKTMSYLDNLNKYFQDQIYKYSKKKIILYQELGGFIAQLSLYHVCMKLGIKHVFFEPSFFKGRLHNVFNSLRPIQIPNDLSKFKINENVLNYIADVTKDKSIVIPEKDKHHFLDMGLKKAFRFDNFKKMMRKVIYKYVKFEKQEFEHIWITAKRLLVMLKNRKLNSLIYSKFNKDLMKKHYIYFPFHVEIDYSLTIRSTEYLNQLSLVEYITQILPPSIYLYVKEHPASIGGFDNKNLKRLVKQNSNLKIIHPKVNNFDVLNKAKAVITINSKAGAESILLDKEVIVFGDAIYSNSKLVTFVDNIKSLEEKIILIIKKK
jgi:hypothetical protein